MKLLNELIEECIKANALFTVYDIIPEAQARGCVSSNETITAYVKDYRYPIYYTRTIQDMGCEIIVPVYHPADVDASDYDSSDLMPKTIDITSNITDTLSSNVVRKLLDSKYNVGISNRQLFDKRGRYHIKVSDVQQAGFGIGEKVSIMLDTVDNTIVVTNKRQSKRLHQLGAVTVDKDSNISVAKSPFRTLNDTVKPTDIKVKSSKREIKIIPSY